VYSDQGDPELIPGNLLGAAWSQSLFRREKRIRRIVVDLPVGNLRQ